MKEDKQEICTRLRIALNATREYSNIDVMIYKKKENGDETVYACFPNCTKEINVSADSGAAMIRDIVNGLK